MEEYNFIKNITETVLNKIHYYNNNKIKPMLELLIDKLYNYEDNLEQINENINDIYNIYMKQDMTFEEKELSILRDAVDNITSKQGKKIIILGPDQK